MQAQMSKPATIVPGAMKALFAPGWKRPAPPTANVRRSCWPKRSPGSAIGRAVTPVTARPETVGG